MGILPEIFASRIVDDTGLRADVGLPAGPKEWAKLKKLKKSRRKTRKMAGRLWLKFNPNHDARGRFASGSGRGFTSPNPGDAKEDRSGMVAGDDIRVVETTENSRFDEWATKDRLDEVREWTKPDDFKEGSITVAHDEETGGNSWSRSSRIAMKMKIAEEVGARVKNEKGGPTEAECTAFAFEHSLKTVADSHEHAASIVVDSWASSSNGHNSLSCAIQLSAERVTGVKNARKVAENNEAAHEILEKHGKVLDSINRAIYQNTQEKLEAAGVDGLVVYRGMKWNSHEKMPDALREIVDNGKTHTGLSDPKHGHAGLIKYADVPDVQLNPISSFASIPTEAVKFAGGNLGAIAGTYVPRKEIFSTALTGVGCLSEHEIVVMHKDNRPQRIVAFDYTRKLTYDKFKTGGFWEHQDD